MKEILPKEDEAKAGIAALFQLTVSFQLNRQIKKRPENLIPERSCKDIDLKHLYAAIQYC